MDLVVPYIRKGGVDTVFVMVCKSRMCLYSAQHEN